MRLNIGKMTIAAAVAAAVSAVAPAGAGATFAGSPGTIAISACTGDCGVFLVDPAGSGAAQITHNPFRIQLPRGMGSYPAPDSPSSWTPDGRRLLYMRARDVDGPESRIVNAEGTGDQPFAAAPPPQPVFSPDGSKLAYIEYIPPGYPQIFVMNVDGSGVSQVTHGEGPGSGAYDPDWSPDGTKIAYTGPGTSIYVMNADGSSQTNITSEPGAWEFDPSWSPDGAKIAYTRSYQGQQYEIFSVNSDGSGTPRNLTDNFVGAPDYTRIDDEGAAWSPDGTQIAFTQRSGNPIRLLVMNADGSGKRELPTGAGVNGGPVWQSLRGPRRGDYRNASQFCRAEQDFWGAEAFRSRYGGGANAHGKCVSGS